MNNTDFNALVGRRVECIRATLTSKGKEYGSKDRLYNLKRAAEILRTTPQRALAGMWVKHLVSVLDLVEEKLPPTDHYVDEKIGDAINYLILLEALLKENTYCVEEKKPYACEECKNRGSKECKAVLASVTPKRTLEKLINCYNCNILPKEEKPWTLLIECYECKHAVNLSAGSCRGKRGSEECLRTYEEKKPEIPRRCDLCYHHTSCGITVSRGSSACLNTLTFNDVSTPDKKPKLPEHCGACEKFFRSVGCSYHYGSQKCKSILGVK